MTRRWPALLAATALAACSLDPHYVRPSPAVPPGWPAGDAYLRTSEAALPSVDYRQIFRDPRLQAIVARALANNQDLAAAAANIESARAQYRIQRAQLLPQVDASARVTRSNGLTSGGVTGTSGSGGIGGTGTGAGTTGGTGGTTGSGTIGTGGGTGSAGTGTGSAGSATTGTGGSTVFSVQLGVTAFELDLFGRLHSLARASLQQYLATEAAARAVRLTLVSDIANAYLTLAADRSLLAISIETEASARSMA